MPELVDREALAISREIREKDPSSKKELEKLVAGRDWRLVGKGWECVVVEDKNKPDRVVAIAYRDIPAKKMKGVFYLQRIFSTLFPHNFPHFYAAFSEWKKGDKRGFTGTVREEIRKKRGWFFRREKIRYPFKPVIDFYNKFNIPASLDSFEGNFLIGADGGEYYVDTLGPQRSGEWDLPRIMEYMEKAESEEGEPLYTQRDGRIVRRSIERLAELGLSRLKG